MRRSILVCLLLAGLALIWSLAIGAQVIDPTPCRTACDEQRAACVTACGEHADPLACEARCEDESESCFARCPVS